MPDRLSTRAEVVACLDRIIEFYDRTEPASPVPYLARRMRRMVPMDFLELMEDLAPSGLKEFRLARRPRRRQEAAPARKVRRHERKQGQGYRAQPRAAGADRL